MTPKQENSDAPVVFTFESSEISTFADDKGEMWASVNDVCAILGYVNPRRTLQLHCRPKGVTKRYTLTPGGQQEATFINEPNLYRLIIKSRKPEAEKFEAWVMEEVLPAIRKNGYYDARRGMPQLTVAQLLSTQRQVCALMQALKRETEPALRRTLHAQLEQLCRLLALPVPALDAIGRDALPDHQSPVLEEFWDTYETLQDLWGEKLNHARGPFMIAINLPQMRVLALKADLPLAEGTELRRLLKASIEPRFVGVKAVNSARTDRTMKCWVFNDA